VEYIKLFLNLAMSFCVKLLMATWIWFSNTIQTKYLFGTATQNCYFNDRNFELREENQQSARQSVDPCIFRALGGGDKRAR